MKTVQFFNFYTSKNKDNDWKKFFRYDDFYQSTCFYKQRRFY